MMKGLDLGEELKTESEPLKKLMNEVLGDKVEEMIVSNRMVDSLRVLTMSEQGLSVNTKRIMKAQVPLDSSTDLASGSQQYDSSQQQQQPQTARQSTRQEKEKERGERKKERKGEGERGRSEREEKGREERESVRKGQRGRGQEGRKEEEEREAEKGGGEQVEKDVTGWTEVTKKKKWKTVQIFVRVNGSKATLMDVNLADDKVEDVVRRIQNDEDAYVTMQGKVLKRHEKLKSCGVTDGCMIQVTSSLRGGGKHKDKKGQKERKRAAKPQGPEQKSEEEPRRDKDLVV